MRTKRLLLVALCGALSLTACATNPVTGEREFVLVTEAQEIALGRESDAQVRSQMGVYDDDALQRYVEEIGLEMAARSHRPDLPWSFAVVDSPAVNAFAIPGGFIYLTRGIMAFLGDEADLAGVLGHEIGHVTARHSVQAMTRASGAQLGLAVGSIFSPAARAAGGLAQSGLGVLFLRYGRDAELQADRLGVQYAGETGWDPGGVRDMLSTLSRLSDGSDSRGVPGWLSTHPAASDRVERIGPVIDELDTRLDFTELRVNRAGYLDRLEGLMYGDNPDQGIVRGRDFLHPVLRFALQFPDGWEVINTPTQVVAKQPGEEVYMVLQLVSDPDTTDLERLAGDNMRESGFRLDSGGTTRVGDLEAFIGTFTGERTDTGEPRARVAYIDYGRAIYILGGLTDSSSYDRVESDFNTAIRSFRPLSAAEAEDIRPNRLTFYTVRDGDTWQSIAQDASRSIIPSNTLAIMNGVSVNEQPRRGDRVKIAVEGR
ncbi:MAG: M48 family metalloprotease [Acidobacteria bacterium]|nr:M48 family metalloprotease [Acidobacteriota bacterium]